MEVKNTYEKVNVKRAQFVLHTFKDDKPSFKSLVYAKDEINKKTQKKWDWVSYYDRLMTWLKLVVKNDGVMKTVYHKPKSIGRQYLIPSQFGVQSLQRGLRGFLCEMYDYDLVNSHYEIALGYARLYKLPHKNIQTYCENREMIWETTGRNKHQMIAIMYSDTIHNYKNKYLKALAEELKILRDYMCDNDYNQIPTNNEQNPKGSMLSQGFQNVEDGIIQSIINHYKMECVVKMMDGFMSENEMDCEELTRIANKEYTNPELQNFKIVHKPPAETTLVMPDNWQVPDYEAERKQKLMGMEQRVNVFNENNCYITSIRRYYSFQGVWTGMNLSEFNDLHIAQEEVEMGEKMMPWVEWWRKKGRKEYIKRDFYPFNPNHTTPDNHKCPPEVFNCFTPFKRCGRTCDNVERTEKFIEMFKELLFHLCEDNIELSTYLLKYIAHLIQKPYELPETIINLYGNQGTGKDTVYRTVERLLDDDEYTKSTSNSSQGTGRFNSMLDGALWIDFNEGTGKQAVENLEALKHNSTAPKVQIERKGIDVVAVKNYGRYCNKSNNSNFVIISDDDRRMFVVLAMKYLSAKYGICPEDCEWGGTNPGSMKKGERGNKWFFGKYNEYLQDEDCVNGLFNYLDSISLSDFNIREFPKGKAYDANVSSNYKPIIGFLREFVSRKLQPTHRYGVYNHKNTSSKRWLCPKTEFFQDYKSFCIDRGIENRCCSTQDRLITELLKIDETIPTNKRPSQSIGGIGKPRCLGIDPVSLKDILDRDYPCGVEEDEIVDIDDIEPPKCFENDYNELDD